MSQPIPAPTSSADLVRVLSQLVDAELESPHQKGDRALIRVHFQDRVPQLWWHEAISTVTGAFGARDIELNFVLHGSVMEQEGIKSGRIEFVIP